ncbi:DUF1688 family protein [Mycobacterium sp. NPDC048908]|uniref:DUF1688 family protein n=1 Tax=Mycobacterium sp. NPDC048908 TaxID=3364292 RepID=UPI00371EFCEB
MSLAGVRAEHDTNSPVGAVTALRTTTAIRERAHYLLTRARAGDSPWFVVDDDSLHAAAADVADLTRARYPDLHIPFHSRWRHFEAGGVERRADLDPRAMVDLTVVSVLLDAGAGPNWHYLETTTGQRFSRSEGLGVASWHAFCAGVFSSDPARPLQVDGSGLRDLTAAGLADAFQCRPGNPLVGLEGRVSVLHRLAEALGPDGRPCDLFDLTAGRRIAAHDILTKVLTSLSRVWLAPNDIGDEPLGDCWRHAAVPGPGLTGGWVPFHKLSQWLTYSLLEPVQCAGMRVENLDELTGLPEYRNGGLLLDTGVLRLRDPEWAVRSWDVGDELVVEWRALTVALLDELAPLVRTALGVAADHMPLACVLEGGTWAAGRALAARLRDGSPPISVVSDGTVF